MRAFTLAALAAFGLAVTGGRADAQFPGDVRTQRAFVGNGYSPWTGSYPSANTYPTWPQAGTYGYAPGYGGWYAPAAGYGTASYPAAGWSNAPGYGYGMGQTWTGGYWNGGNAWYGGRRW